MKKFVLVTLMAVFMAGCVSASYTERLKGNYTVIKFKDDVLLIKYVAQNKRIQKNAIDMAMWLTAQACLKQEQLYFEILSQTLLWTADKKAAVAEGVEIATANTIYPYIEQVVRCHTQMPRSKFYSVQQVKDSVKASHPEGFRFK